MVLCRILMIFVLLFSNIEPLNMSSNNILEIMTSANEVIVYKDDSHKTIKTESEDLTQLHNELINLSKSCRESPAFGVSLNNETIEARKNGTWIEFNFNQTITHKEMPFDALLINVVGEYTGFNIIRKYDDKYDGRCFYIDLIDYDLSNLENLINNMF